MNQEDKELIALLSSYVQEQEVLECIHELKGRVRNYESDLQAVKEKRANLTSTFLTTRIFSLDSISGKLLIFDGVYYLVEYDSTAKDPTLKLSFRKLEVIQ